MGEFELKDRVVCWDYCSTGVVVKVPSGGYVSVLWDGTDLPVTVSTSQVFPVARQRFETQLEVL